jgi:hypothetical protein
MSLEAVDWAVSLDLRGVVKKAVLMVLAYRTNKATGTCHPSIARLCAETGASKKPVIAALQELEKMGLITTQKTYGAVTVYRCQTGSTSATGQEARTRVRSTTSSRSTTGSTSATAPGAHLPPHQGQKCPTEPGKNQERTRKGGSGGKQKKKNGIDYSGISGLNLEAWESWQAHRRECRIKPYVSDRKARWLATLPHDTQQAIIDQSIENQWQGLFPLKTQKPKPAKGNGSARLNPSGARPGETWEQYEKRMANENRDRGPDWIGALERNR